MVSPGALTHGCTTVLQAAKIAGTLKMTRANVVDRIFINFLELQYQRELNECSKILLMSKSGNGVEERT